eukprot:10670457-Karenia_brevis.AAC.1
MDLGSLDADGDQLQRSHHSMSHAPPVVVDAGTQTDQLQCSHLSQPAVHVRNEDAALLNHAST